MNRIFVTGDMHLNIDFNKIFNFAARDIADENDFLIICGDVGLGWNKSYEVEKIFNRLKSYKFTTLFVDGNHENFNYLNSFKVEYWNGGKVHKLADNIIHLMRGQVFEICGKTFLTMGGATSVDKARRVPQVSWWPEEAITFDDLNEAYENLEKYDYKIDYVLSHTAPESIVKDINFNYKEIDFCNKALENIKNKIEFKTWYFGHYHVDMVIKNKYNCLYNSIKEVENE